MMGLMGHMVDAVLVFIKQLYPGSEGIEITNGDDETVDPIGNKIRDCTIHCGYDRNATAPHGFEQGIWHPFEIGSQQIDMLLVENGAHFLVGDNP